MIDLNSFFLETVTFSELYNSEWNFDDCEGNEPLRAKEFQVGAKNLLSRKYLSRKIKEFESFYCCDRL